MSLSLKPLHQQVIFITGASSGIGLATVKLAAAAGAKVFMVARNEDELQNIQDEMRQKNFATAYAVADVAEFDQLQTAADRCLTTFGRIDTWVNNAGISLFSKVLDTTEEEARRLFDTNFWGIVNGCKIAVPLMRHNGGAIINIGSVLSKVAVPLQGIYSAAEHAVKGFTDALRKELNNENSRISLTLVSPGSIDTPFLKHARSHVGDIALLPPVYAPEAVARIILKCAISPVKETGIGSSSFVSPLIKRFLPRKKIKAENRPAVAPKTEGEIHSDLNGHVKHSSIAAGGLAIVGAALLLFRKLRII